MNKEFFRVKVATADGPRWYWATDFRANGDTFTFKKCKPDGDTWHGREGDTVCVCVGTGADLMAKKPARMNLKYGTLEVVK